VIALLGLELWELALYETAMFTVVQLHHANVALPAWLDRGLRMLIVTPFMHKVHHSRWQPETDSNYSSLFSFWDKFFRPSGYVRTRTLEFSLENWSARAPHTDRSVTPWKPIRGRFRGGHGKMINP
jgi:sterol desaturase/sphingolipid hydroxylase (fatty acid hydroxylase superfamily)